jgi:hypothetical protein
MSKIFGSKEEADAYNKYVVVEVYGVGGVSTKSFRTRGAAETYNQDRLNKTGQIMTRRQFNEYKKNNPEYFK